MLKIKTNEYAYKLQNNEQPLDLMCIFDSRINKNELPMIDMKNAI